MNSLQVLKLYIEDLLEPNKVGISRKLMEEAERMFPQRFSYAEGEHPFDLNYNERNAYYRGLCHSYKEILYKINNMLEQ